MDGKKLAAFICSFGVILGCMLMWPHVNLISQCINAFVIGNLLIVNAMLAKEIWRPVNTPLWEDSF